MTYIVTGYYGSGKTEFVLNLAAALARGAGGYKPPLQHQHACSVGANCVRPQLPVTIADLDVINPFFRSRERAKELAPLGIQVMGSVFENHVAQDIPALSFAFLSRIRSNQNVIIDLAGGENGLKLLAGCYDAIGAHEFLCVLNLYRPETDSAAKMADFCKQINAFSRIPITGLVNNGHMLGFTETGHILESQKAVLEVAKELGVPLKYTLAQENIYKEISQVIVSEKVLTFPTPQMRENWQM